MHSFSLIFILLGCTVTVECTGGLFKDRFKEAEKKYWIRPPSLSKQIQRQEKVRQGCREEEKGHEEEGGQKPEEGYSRQPSAQCGSTLRQVCLVDYRD